MKPKKKSQKKIKTTNHLLFGLFSYWSLIGLLLGIIAGLAYYFSYGMMRTACIFSSNPFVVASWGALLGFAVFELFRVITLDE